MTTKPKHYTRGVVVALLIMVTAVVAGGTAMVMRASSVSAQGQPRYCSDTVKRNCLQRLQVAVWTNQPPAVPVADCTINFRFYNPNQVTVPRNITVFRDGQEFFGDDDFLSPGFTPALGAPPLTFGPLPDGTWRVVVSSLGTTFADKTFSFHCGN